MPAFMPKNRMPHPLGKLLWPVVIGIVGGVMTPLILSWIQDHSPHIVVHQYLNTTKPQKPVPHKIGGLILDYQSPPATTRTAYLIEVINDGTGPEEDLRVQVGFPSKIKVTYTEAPDLRVYRAEEVSLHQNSFFMNLKQFPSHAQASVSFAVEGISNLAHS